MSDQFASARERQITRDRKGHVLTNAGVWSPDGQWIVYDTRPDPAGEIFEGETIEMANILTGEVRELFRSQNGARCGVAAFHSRRNEVVFILGPENPTSDWQYCAWHRQGVLVDADRPGGHRNLDARDLTPPFTPGALRGGTHVHQFSPDGQWVSFTYEDHLLAQRPPSVSLADRDLNQRNVGVGVPSGPVRVGKDHPRNHDGEYFCVLVTRTTAAPKPGSDDISRAFEESWVGTNGYQRADGRRQVRALAFQGQVTVSPGVTISEVFIVDLPDDLTREGRGPLAGTENRMPCPPQGVAQRRLTRTENRKYPGLQGPRHWLRSAPDGSRIAFLMKDDQGVAQLWTVSPNGGNPAQLTRNPWPVASAFTWSPDGKWLAIVADHSVFLADSHSGQCHRLTPRTPDARTPRPEACVFSPDGRRIAFARQTASPEGLFNQVFVVELP